MASITNSVRIDGKSEAVFDLVTTTRFWPQWHPATVGIGGVTERPFQVGDLIRERAQIGARTYEGTWRVIEHLRPLRTVLRGESGRIQIIYTFQADGEATIFSRQLDFYPEDFAASVTDPALVEKLMHAQSEQALQKLQRLVELILQNEAKVEISPSA